MPEQCALPECNEEIEQPENGPRRTFCCPAHRTAARAARLRAEAAAAQQDPAADDARERLRRSVEEALDRRDAERDAIAPAPAPIEPHGRPSIGPPVEAPGPDATHPSAPVSTAAGDGDPTPPETGPRIVELARPPWSPGAGERDGVAAVRQPGPGSTRSGGTRQAPTRPEPTPRGTTGRRTPVAPRRRHRVGPAGTSVMAAGLVVALALGGGSVLWHHTPDTPAGPPESAPSPPAGNHWLNAANVTLLSVNQQMDVAKAAIAEWYALPADQRAGGEPVELKALEDRVATLERDRAVLVSQLAAWQFLQQSSAALAQAQQNRAALDAAAPPPSSVRPSPSADSAQAQQGVLDSQIASLQQQTNQWRQDVDAAMNAPMPDTHDTTTRLSSALVDLAEHPNRGRPRSPEIGGSNDPTATSTRSPRTGDRSRADASSGAPPRPRGSSDSSDSVLGEGHDDSSGPSLVESAGRSVTDTARALTGTHDESGRESRHSDRSTHSDDSDRSSRSRGDGPVSRVADTVGDVLDGGSGRSHHGRSGGDSDSGSGSDSADRSGSGRHHRGSDSGSESGSDSGSGRGRSDGSGPAGLLAEVTGSGRSSSSSRHHGSSDSGSGSGSRSSRHSGSGDSGSGDSRSRASHGSSGEASFAPSVTEAALGAAHRSSEHSSHDSSESRSGRSYGGSDAHHGDRHDDSSRSDHAGRSGSDSSGHSDSRSSHDSSSHDSSSHDSSTHSHHSDRGHSDSSSSGGSD